MARGVRILIAFGVVLLCLLGRIFYMQVFQYDYYQAKVIDQITVTSNLTAKRGNIYDANMNLLATNKFVWRIFISPRDIFEYSKKYDTDYAHLIASGLSELLNVPYETIYEKTQKTNRLDETIQKEVDDATKDKVLAFVTENNLSRMVYAQASVSRYYPFGSLAAHTIGFAGSDNQGLFGLESYYEDDLRGTDGKYITAVDSYGDEIPYDYTSYVPAIDGLSLVTTIDTYIQRELENELAEIIEEFNVQNRATGIVMDVNTGAILAMATAPSFNLNDPYTLDSISQAQLDALGYEAGSAEYNTAKNNARYAMWNNKAINDLYEPGSTFKIITAAMGIELGVTSANDASFSCGGRFTVGGVGISCWRPAGHGSHFSFAYGLQQSCNPTLMQLAARITSPRFYQYFAAFGYLDKTGIDLPGESTTIFHKENALGSVELAVASFGQRFKVTPLAQISAIAAVANGGYVVTPHLIDSFIDSEGNTVYKYSAEKKRQVISEETAYEVSRILEEGVSGTGASKNAYVAGYRIAAKTGTSEKLDKPDANGNYSLRIGSCVGYAPYDDASVAVLIVVDEPTVNFYGATVAAPYISDLLSKILPYLGYEPHYTEEEMASMTVPIGNYVGQTVAAAKKKLAALGITADALGAGDDERIVAQIPASGTSLTKQVGTVLLYTENVETEYTTVPDLIGKSVAEANQILLSRRLNIKIEGAKNYAISDTLYALAKTQSIPAGTSVKKGTVITVKFLYDDED